MNFEYVIAPTPATNGANVRTIGTKPGYDDVYRRTFHKTDGFFLYALFQKGNFPIKNFHAEVMSNPIVHSITYYCRD